MAALPQGPIRARKSSMFTNFLRGSFSSDDLMLAAAVLGIVGIALAIAGGASHSERGIFSGKGSSDVPAYYKQYVRSSNKSPKR